MDLPGFGESETPPSSWSATDYAERIREYADERSIKTFDLFGHSFGGKVACILAQRYPERVCKLVLCNASGLTRRKQSRQVAIRILGKVTKGVDKTLKTTLFKTRFAPRFASLDYQNAGPMRDILVRSINEDITPLAQGIAAETLLIWGEKDQETPLYMGERYHELIPNSKLLVLEGKGHSPFEDAGYHLLTTYMEPFLR